MGRSAEPRDAPRWDLFAEMHALIESGDRRFRLLSTLEGVDEALSAVEASVRVSVWNMQRHASLHEIRAHDHLNERSRRKGVEMRYLLPPHVAQRRCPLVSSRFPYLRLTPVGHPLLIADGTRMLVGNAPGNSVWVTSDADLVGRGIRLYDRLWQDATPAVPEGQEPPFTPRMVQVGVMLAEGATDGEIARAVGVSERTVSSEVREMSRRLGARSRAHAIALISGVEG